MPTDRHESQNCRLDEAIWRPWAETVCSFEQRLEMKDFDLPARIFKKFARCGVVRKLKGRKSNREEGHMRIPKRAASHPILKNVGAHRDDRDGHSRKHQASQHRSGRVVQFQFYDGSPGSASEELFPADIDVSETSRSGHQTVRRSLKRSKSADPETSALKNSFFHDFDIRPQFLRKKRGMPPPIDTQHLVPKITTVEPEMVLIPNSPSSYNPSAISASPNSQASTAPTSIFSNVSSVQSQNSQETKMPLETVVENGLSTTTTTIEEPMLSPIQEPVPRYLEFLTQDTHPAPVSSATLSVSISTSEKAAATKIYLEAYFSKAFCDGPTDRSIRRRAFERDLDSMSVSDEQLRVLKTTSLIRHGMKGIDIAGYEVVRVLGKGSFGVVRLVTEKSKSSTSLIDPMITMNGSPDIAPTVNKRSALKLLKPDEVYAMKVIRKSTMLRNSQEAHLRAERDFLVASSGSRWVVPLIASFQDNTNLYLVMEYMVGGDFLGLLLREDVLDESVARWYIAEIVLCIEEAHRMRWIHRDIKPDNFLIDARGHLKISDFGLAFDGWWGHDQGYFARHRYSMLDRLGIKVRGDYEDQTEAHTGQPSAPNTYLEQQRSHPDLRDDINKDASAPLTGGLLSHRDRTERRQMAKSIVGTGQYMAPEIILGRAYDGRCDWWSLGVILYECLYGRTPFYRENRQATKECIVRHEETLYFPDSDRWSRPGSEYRRWLPGVSGTAIDLMQGLLCEREGRLGSRAYRWSEFRPGRLRHFGGGLGGGNSGAGRYVVPNAAEEIKSHPWFSGVP
ncbi:serine/threonine-protein kinase-18 [Elsinoe australis]|uniref:non-specific serine/threonine protein kinase n=1 Tax=Elsinoe australis TaxID=40998 RepID=A0A4U7AWP4_9PEZI|nr:serine/threonine-protein kinase-18 [Elsinoe australis]